MDQPKKDEHLTIRIMKDGTVKGVHSGPLGSQELEFRSPIQAVMWATAAEVVLHYIPEKRNKRP